jgi:hypothetical protein
MVRASLDSSASFKRRNLRLRQVHAYARGKGEYLASAVKLLENFISEEWASEQEEQHATAPGEPTMPTAQHTDWDGWDVLFDMRKWRCPRSDRYWYSTDDAATWFMPDAGGLRSICGRWTKRQDSRTGFWWCNADDRKLFFLAAA